MRTLIGLLIVSATLIAGGGCGDPQPAPPQPAPAQPAAQPAPVPAAPAPVAPEPPAALPADEPGPPALDLAPVDLARRTEAKERNRAGLKAHKAGDYPTAISAFGEALAANPGNLTARYNLACAHARAGDHDRAISLLGQLKAGGCVLCLKRLLAATRDQDFDGLRADRRFVELTAGLQVEEPDYRKLARQVARTLARRDPAPLLATLAAGRHVETRFIWEDLSDGEDPPEQHVEILTDEAAVNKYVRTHGIIMGEDHGLRAGKVSSCQGNCCSFVHDSCLLEYRIERLCFWPVSATTAVPVLVDVFGCGS